MAGRIRGHYRIDAGGHVVLLADVNAGMKPYCVPKVRSRALKSEQNSRVIKMAVLGFAILSIFLAAMSIMPMVERSMVAADAKRVAMARSAFFRTHPAYRSGHMQFRFNDR